MFYYKYTVNTDDCNECSRAANLIAYIIYNLYPVTDLFEVLCQ